MISDRYLLDLDELEKRIREKALTKNSKVIKAVSKILKIVDEQPNTKVDLKEELPDILGDAGIILNTTELNELARNLDYMSTGTSTYGKIFKTIAPPLNKTRMSVVEAAFKALSGQDLNSIPTTSLSLSKKKTMHGAPKLATKTFTGELVYSDFNHLFSDEPEITLEEFTTAYRIASASIKTDQEFVEKVKRTWDLK